MLSFSFDLYFVRFEIDEDSEESFYDHVLVDVVNLIEIVFLAGFEDMRGVMFQYYFQIFQSDLIIVSNASY